MKLIQYILLAAVFTGLALACDKTGPEGGNTGTPDGCPVTYVRFPAQTIYSGDRIPVIGSGFSDRADFFLVNTVSGTSIEITDVTVTASGIEMTVDAVAGEYIFVIEQDGRWELGTITVEARPIDVTVGTFPQYCIPGESLTVTGMGFAESATLTLESPDGTRTSLRTEASESSLTAIIPDDSPKGRLKLIIVQDNGEQTVSSTFFVTTVKRLMTFRSTVGSGESTVVRELSFTRDGDGSVTGCSPFSLSVNQGSDGRTEYNFTASADNEEEGYYSFILKVDQGRNRVVSSTFELERTDPGSGQVTTVTEEFPWDYGNTGFLSWYDGRMSNELSAVDGKNQERDYCILTLFLNCGLRISELVNLDCKDIQEDALRVLGKGNKVRILYLNDACQDALKRYLAVRRPITGRDADALFLSSQNERISRSTVHAMVKKRLLEAGLDVREYSSHKLRHTAATLMLQNGVDVRAVQEVLGHDHLNTTEIYTHVQTSRLMGLHRLYHPRTRT